MTCLRLEVKFRCVCAINQATQGWDRGTGWGRDRSPEDPTLQTPVGPGFQERERKGEGEGLNVEWVRSVRGVAEWGMRLVRAEVSEEVKANKSQGKQLKRPHEEGEHALIYLFTHHSGCFRENELWWGSGLAWGWPEWEQGHRVKTFWGRRVRDDTDLDGGGRGEEWADPECISG